MVDLKTAAFLAFIGSLLVALFLTVTFVRDAIMVAQGVVAAATLIRSLLFAVAAVMVSVFFYTFHRSH